VIAVYTFSVVWWRIEMSSVRFAWTVVGVIWTYSILFVMLMAWRYRWDTLFHPSPVWRRIYLLDIMHVLTFRDQYWCWMGKYYIVQKLFAEYFWVWSALFLSIVLYIPLFFWSLGYLTPDKQVWWKFRIHARTPWARETDSEINRRRSMNMIAYAHPLLS
jgi:hypothetical protein